jgi:hypothetical protein
VQSPTPGYNHFMMSLSIGPTGTIHLTAQMYHSHTGDNADLAGRGIVYLSSADGGDTWDNEGDRVDGPGTIDTMNLVCRRESGISISNHVVDDDDQPWLFTRDPETTPVSVLWRRTGSGWEASDLRAAFDAGFHAMQAGSLSRDAAGTLHAVLGAHPGGGEVAWSDPGCELFRVPIGADGTVGRAAQVTPTVDGVPAWLPAVETWQWRRPEAVGQGGHWMLYTRGHNQSDQEGGCANVGATQVWVGRLPAV